MVTHALCVCILGGTVVARDVLFVSCSAHADAKGIMQLIRQVCSPVCIVTVR